MFFVFNSRSELGCTQCKEVNRVHCMSIDYVERNIESEPKGIAVHRNNGEVHDR